MMQPHSHMSLDFITELPSSKGYDAILVVVAHDVTKATVIIPCKTMITADQTTALYLNHVWKCFGLPCKIISNQGMQFTALQPTSLMPSVASWISIKTLVLHITHKLMVKLNVSTRS